MIGSILRGYYVDSHAGGGRQWGVAQMAKARRRISLKAFSSTLAGACLLALGVGAAGALDLDWKDAIAAASKALEEWRYVDAEQWLRTAVRESEKFGPEDRRLAESLNRLGTVLYAQGKYAEAEQSSSGR